MKRFQIATLSLALIVILLGRASGGDWPQWRGANRDGVSPDKGDLKQWPEGGPKLLWKATGLGTGFGSVSVLGDRLYTTGENADGGRVLAMKVSDGSVVWATVFCKSGGDPAGPQASPALDGNSVYVISQFGDVVCLEARAGKERWRRSMTADFGGSVPGWNYSESPLLDANRIVCTPGGAKGAMVALDKSNGQTLWQSSEFTDAAHHSSAITAQIGGVSQYIQLTASSVAGVNAATGALLWRADRQGQTAVVPTPICAEGFIYVTSGYGVGCNLFEVHKAGKEFKATQVYALPQIANHHGGVIKVGDHLYGYSDTGGWICQEFKTGKVLWKEKGVGKGAVAYADGHLYCRSESGKGTVALVDATPGGYVEKGRFDQPDRSDKHSWAHPVVVGGRLYLRDQDVLLCYDVRAR